MHTHTYLHMYVYIYRYINIYMYIRIFTYLRVCICIYRSQMDKTGTILIFMNMLICMFHMHACRTLKERLQPMAMMVSLLCWKYVIHVYMYIYTCIYVYKFVYMYSYIHMYVYIYMYMCIYTCFTHVCMYSYIHKYK